MCTYANAHVHNTHNSLGSSVVRGSLKKISKPFWEFHTCGKLHFFSPKQTPSSPSSTSLLAYDISFPSASVARSTRTAQSCERHSWPILFSSCKPLKFWSCCLFRLLLDFCTLQTGCLEGKRACYSLLHPDTTLWLWAPCLECCCQYSFPMSLGGTSKWISTTWITGTSEPGGCLFFFFWFILLLKTSPYP